MSQAYLLSHTQSTLNDSTFLLLFLQCFRKKQLLCFQILAGGRIFGLRHLIALAGYSVLQSLHFLPNYSHCGHCIYKHLIRVPYPLTFHLPSRGFPLHVKENLNVPDLQSPGSSPPW